MRMFRRLPRVHRLIRRQAHYKKPDAGDTAARAALRLSARSKAKELGRVAGDLLLRHARGEEVEASTLMPVLLQDRGSTAPPRR